MKNKVGIKRLIKRISFAILIIAILIGLGVGVYWLVVFKIPQSKGKSFIENFEKTSQTLSDLEYMKQVNAIIEHPDTFNTGSEDWDSRTLNDFTTAIKPKIEQLAYKGNPDAAYLMGSLIGSPSFFIERNGRVYKDDNDTKAAFFYRVAADGGHPKAQAMLAKYYFYGKGVQKNYVEAYEWAYKSANNNCAEGLTLLGKFYSTGIYGGIAKYIANNNIQLFDDNCVTLSRNFPHDKVILRPDITKARKLWKKALDMGNEDAKKFYETVYSDEEISMNPNVDYDAH